MAWSCRQIFLTVIMLSSFRAFASTADVDAALSKMQGEWQNNAVTTIDTLNIERTSNGWFVGAETCAEDGLTCGERRDFYVEKNGQYSICIDKDCTPSLTGMVTFGSISAVGNTVNIDESYFGVRNSFTFNLDGTVTEKGEVFDDSGHILNTWEPIFKRIKGDSSNQ